MLSIHINTEYSGISPYSLMILLSVIAGVALQYFLNIKRGVKKSYAIYLVFLAPIMGIESGLLLTKLLTHGKGFGLSSIGGLLGMYMAAFMIGKISRDRYAAKAMLENCTLVLPMIYSISKIGCLLAGCCYGISYHGPFCIEYSGSGIRGMCVFPVQLAETVVFFVIFIIGMTMAIKRKKNAVLCVFMTSASAKFLLDYLRDSHIDCVISVNQSLCLVMMLIAAVLMIADRKSRSAEEGYRGA